VSVRPAAPKAIAEITEVWEDSGKNTAIVSTINRGIQRKEVAGIPATNRELSAPHLFIVS